MSWRSPITQVRINKLVTITEDKGVHLSGSTKLDLHLKTHCVCHICRPNTSYLSCIVVVYWAPEETSDKMIRNCKWREKRRKLHTIRNNESEQLKKIGFTHRAKFIRYFIQCLFWLLMYNLNCTEMKTKDTSVIKVIAVCDIITLV